MEQLNGGLKTLVVLAFILAILFDEVDAALDADYRFVLLLFNWKLHLLSVI